MKVSGTFVAREAATHVDIGFIPDHIKAYELTSTAEVMYDWYRCLYDKASTFMYGISHHGDGAIADVGSADDGFIPYEEGEDVGVSLPNPQSGKLEKATVTDWNTATTNYSSGASDRTATTLGTVVRPPIHNGYVYELKTGAAAGTSEPTAGWGTVPGELSTDGGSNVWICRKEVLAKGGGMGFTIGATLSVNTDIWVFEAEKHLRSEDMGDADSGDPVSFDRGGHVTN